MITESASRPYGHVPGHSYLDVEVRCLRSGSTAVLVTWGSAQGQDEEHGREEYARATLSGAREAALQAQESRTCETSRLIETACAQVESRVARRAACEVVS